LKYVVSPFTQTAQMCDYCQKVLSGVTVLHKPIECQYRRSMYCYVCGIYGHCPSDCPNKKALAIRQGEDPTSVKNLEIRVADSDAGIKFVLKQFKITPTSTQAGNRNLLNDLANSLTPPRMIIFVGSKKIDEIHSESVQKKVEQEKEAKEAKN
jgi:hypothetical protein